MIIDAKYYFEPRVRLYKVMETDISELGEHVELNQIGYTPIHSLTLTQDDLLEKVEAEGFKLTDIKVKGDKATVRYEKSEDGITTHLTAKYWGGLEVSEANEVLETPDSHYEMTRIPPGLGETLLKEMGGAYTRVEKSHGLLGMSEIYIGEDDEDGDLRGVGLVLSPSRFWPTRYERENPSADSL